MKHSGTCPKCDSKDVVLIPGKHKSHSGGNTISMGVSAWFDVRVSRYLCMKCGYSEEWVDNYSDRQRLKKKYTHA